MQRLGKVQDWNDERGYGFITPLDATGDGARTFFHIRDYQQAGRRPEPGELIKYVATRQSDGRWRATQVRRAVQSAINSGRPKPVPQPYKTAYSAASDLLRAGLVLAYIAFIAWAVERGMLLLETAFIPAIACIVTCMAYAADKHFAQSNRWRIPEAHLHLLELLGGWPGALVAQRVLRHKTRKASYRIVFWMMVALNVAAMTAWAFWSP
jgi:uncharacterized membrane protein YsdA (DUF1294 family)/cold shock CspA family protein